MFDTNEFLNFINESKNAYMCTNLLKNILLNTGFIELQENYTWEYLEKGKNYFVIRNDSSIIAFKLNYLENYNSNKFNMVLAHSDSPTFKIKPNAEKYKNGYLKVYTNDYGGLINYTWFDRPLSLAGRVIYEKDNTLQKTAINIDKNLMVIPSQAVHINREVNDKASFNRQIDLIPIMALEDLKIKDILKAELEKNGIQSDKIYDYDLYLYNRDEAKLCGANNEFVLSPRLDDIASVYPGLQAFLNSNNSNCINIFGVFNNEEIGSMTMQGADSNFLNTIITRLANYFHFDINSVLDNSFIISADNAHAFHPNALIKNDEINTVEINKGIAIKHHIHYATDALSSSILKKICDNNNIPYQDFTCRSDLRCGSTLGRINQKYINTSTVDIGIPQLAMHSSNELAGTKDLENIYNLFNCFYNTNIVKNNNFYEIR